MKLKVLLYILWISISLLMLLSSFFFPKLQLVSLIGILLFHTFVVLAYTEEYLCKIDKKDCPILKTISFVIYSYIFTVPPYLAFLNIAEDYEIIKMILLLTISLIIYTINVIKYKNIFKGNTKLFKTINTSLFFIYTLTLNVIRLFSDQLLAEKMNKVFFQTIIILAYSRIFIEYFEYRAVKHGA